MDNLSPEARQRVRVANLRKNTIGNDELTQGRWRRMRRGAILRGHCFNVTFEDVWGLMIKQGRKCALSGLPLTFGQNKFLHGTASLDRINSRIGYITGNIQWLHKDINRMKHRHSDAEFIALCAAVATHCR